MSTTSSSFDAAGASQAYRNFLTTVIRAELDGQTVTGLGDAEGAELDSRM